MRVTQRNAMRKQYSVQLPKSYMGLSFIYFIPVVNIGTPEPRVALSIGYNSFFAAEFGPIRYTPCDVESLPRLFS